MKTNSLKVFGFAALTALCANVWAAVSGLPQAVVSEITDSTELATYKANIVNVESVDEVDDIHDEIHLNSTTVFELTPKRAFKFACDPNDTASAYSNWYADYTVSFDKSVAKNSMGLFGNYGSYSIGFFAPLEVPANYKVPLLNFLAKNVNWTYSMIRTTVQTFVCGAFNLSADNADTTMTVELRLFDPAFFTSSADVRDTTKWVEGVNTHIVRSIKYKLSDVMNVPAKDGLWPELEYADVAYAEANKAIPAGYYALRGSAFVNLTESMSVDGATAYFKPFEKKEEVKVEADPDEVKENTKVIDKKGEEQDVPADKKKKVEQEVEKAVTEITGNEATLNKTDTGVTAKEILTETKNDVTVVKDSIKKGIKESEEYAKAEPEVKAAVDTALNSRDVSSKINIKLEATSVAIQPTAAAEVTVEKAVFDVTPLATVTVITGTEEKPVKNEFTTLISNKDLEGKTLTVRLPLPKSFTHNVLVVHESEDPDYPAKEEYLVASQVGENGDRFCEVQVNHFCTMTALSTTQPIPVPYTSTDVLGIIRRNDSGSGKENYENAIAVPWMSRNADGDLQQGMTVADLITANGLGEGDELHIWIPDGGTTHQSTIGGTSVTRKGTYAIFRWDAGQKKWIGAKDMGDGELATVGTGYLIPRGAAVWYKRASTTSGDYTIVGLVSNVCETAVAAGTTSNPVMTLLVNPFPEAVDAAMIAGANGDELIINRTSASGTNVSYTRKNGAWGRIVSGTTKIGSLTIPVQTFQQAATIPVANGQSFWYVSRGGSPKINWKSIKTVGNE